VIEETPWVIPTVCRRSRDRERVGRSASWQPAVQKTALGNGFWSLSPTGCTAGGAESWDTPRTPGSHGSRPCWGCFSLSPGLTALHRAQQQSWQGCTKEAPLVAGHSSSVDAHRGQGNRAHLGATVASPTLCSWTVPKPRASQTAGTALRHAGLPALAAGSLGRDTSSRPACGSSSHWRYFTRCGLISLHCGTFFSPAHQAPGGPAGCSAQRAGHHGQGRSHRRGSRTSQCPGAFFTLQELVSAQVHHSCRVVSQRLAWPPVPQPVIPTRPPTHLDRFRNSPVLPARLSCEGARRSWQLSPPQHQQPALPWAPRRPLTTHNWQGSRPNLTLKPSSQHRTEEKQS